MISNSSETCTVNKGGSASKMPKRPLTAYNLYYKYKRAKILEATNTGIVKDKKYVSLLVHATAGLENYPSSMKSTIAPDRLDQIRRNIIRVALTQQLLASDNNKKRKHKKSSGSCNMSFTEMNTVMVESWKKSDWFTKAIFKELAEDGKQEYQHQLNAYYANRKSVVPAIVNPEPKTPVAACTSVPRNKSSNIKESLQGLDMDSMAPIPFVPLPFGARTHITASSSNSIISSGTPQFSYRPKHKPEIPSPARSMAFTNGTFKVHEVTSKTSSQVRSFNGGNFFGDSSRCLAESAFDQGLLPRRVTYNAFDQNWNAVAYSNETSTQDIMPENKEFDDDFMDMINKTLK